MTDGLYRYIGTRGDQLLFHSTVENGQVFGIDKTTYKREIVIPPNEERTLKLVRMVSSTLPLFCIPLSTTLTQRT